MTQVCKKDVGMAGCKNVKKAEFKDYKVRDISLAESGRKAIEIAEHEMPGLMSIRKKYAKISHFRG
jgi:adenosylhomocysteinase